MVIVLLRTLDPYLRLYPDLETMYGAVDIFQHALDHMTGLDLLLDLKRTFDALLELGYVIRPKTRQPIATAHFSRSKVFCIYALHSPYFSQDATQSTSHERSSNFFALTQTSKNHALGFQPRMVHLTIKP